MSRKKEHSKGERQYTKRKKSGSTETTEADKDPTDETEPDRELTETSSGEELPDIPWTKS